MSFLWNPSLPLDYKDVLHFLLTILKLGFFIDTYGSDFCI